MATEKIEDFGHKIGGAKKDLAAMRRNLTIDDISEWTALERKTLINKKVVWVEPDWQELVDNGYSINAAYFIKEIRKRLPAKPTYKIWGDTAEQREEYYIEYISKVREMAMEVHGDDDIPEFFRKLRNEFTEGGRFKNSKKEHGYLDNKLFRFAQTSIRSLEIQRNNDMFLYTDKEKSITDWKFFKYDHMEIVEINPGRSTYRIYDTDYNCIALWSEYIEDNMVNAERLLAEYNWIKDRYVAYCPAADILEINFETLDEAKEFAVSRQADVKKDNKKSNRRKCFVPPLLSQICRTGEDYRKSVDVKGDDMITTFGFYGGEFGNWERQTERQINLNHAYDAFRDLAVALGVEITDVSLGNSLSIAFGARGRGNALAHYEPAANVINLTRMKGAGSLAHEFGHALDAYIARQSGSGAVYATGAYHSIVSKVMSSLKYTERGGWTDFYREAREMDKSYTGYWQSDVELFARAFACYVKDKLAEKGIVNDYLCGHCESAGTKGEERKIINAKFDEMMESLKQSGYLHMKDYEDKTEKITQVDEIEENKEPETQSPVGTENTEKGKTFMAEFNIIGTLNFREIKDRRYVNGPSDDIMKLADELTSQGIPFSGRISALRSTVTLDGLENHRLAMQIYNNIRVNSAGDNRKLGNVQPNYIPDKKFLGGSEDVIRAVSERINNENIKFSALIRGEKSVITVSGEDNRRLVQSYIDFEENRDMISAVNAEGFVSVSLNGSAITAVRSDTGEVKDFTDFAQFKCAYEDESNEFFNPAATRIIWAAEGIGLKPCYTLETYSLRSGAAIGSYRDAEGNAVTYPDVDSMLEYIRANGMTVTNTEAEISSMREADKQRIKAETIARREALISAIRSGSRIMLSDNMPVRWSEYAAEKRELICRTADEITVINAYEAYRANKDISAFFEYICSNADTEIYSFDDDDFEVQINEYLSDNGAVSYTNDELHTEETVKLIAENFEAVRTMNMSAEIEVDPIYSDTAVSMLTLTSMSVYDADHNKMKVSEIIGNEAYFADTDDIQKWGEIEAAADLLDQIIYRTSYTSKLSDLAANAWQSDKSEWQNAAISLARGNTGWIEEYVNGVMNADESIGDIAGDLLAMIEDYKAAYPAENKQDERINAIIDRNIEYIYGFDKAANGYPDIVTYDERGSYFTWIQFDEYAGEHGVLIERHFTEDDVVEAHKARIAADTEEAGRSAFISVINKNADKSTYDASSEDFSECAEKYINLPIRGEAITTFALSENSDSPFNVDKFIEYAERSCAEGIEKISPVHFGLLGYGVTAYDTSRLKINDYPVIAHISDEGVIRYYEKEKISDYDIRMIEREAARLKRKFADEWNKLDDTAKYYRILAAATTPQMADISKLDISTEEVVLFFEHSIILKDEPYPDIADLMAKKAAEHEQDNSVHLTEAAENAGVSDNELLEALEARRTVYFKDKMPDDSVYPIDDASDNKIRNRRIEYDSEMELYILRGDTKDTEGAWLVSFETASDAEKYIHESDMKISHYGSAAVSTILKIPALGIDVDFREIEGIEIQSRDETIGFYYSVNNNDIERFVLSDDNSDRTVTVDEVRDEILEAKANWKLIGVFTDNMRDKLLEEEVFLGSNFQNSKERIVNYYNAHHSESDFNKSFAAFLKKEYGIGGHSAFGNSIASQDHDSSGLKLTYYKTGTEIKEKYTWNEVAKKISQMISEGRYMPESEQDKSVRSQEEPSEQESVEDIIRNALNENRCIYLKDTELGTDEAGKAVIVKNCRIERNPFGEEYVLRGDTETSSKRVLKRFSDIEDIAEYIEQSNAEISVFGEAPSVPFVYYHQLDTDTIGRLLTAAALIDTGDDTLRERVAAAYKTVTDKEDIIRNEYALHDGLKSGDVTVREATYEGISIEFEDGGVTRSTVLPIGYVADKVIELIEKGEYLPERENGDTRDNSVYVQDSFGITENDIRAAIDEHRTLYLRGIAQNPYKRGKLYGVKNPYIEFYGNSGIFALYGDLGGSERVWLAPLKTADEIIEFIEKNHTEVLRFGDIQAPYVKADELDSDTRSRLLTAIAMTDTGDDGLKARVVAAYEGHKDWDTFRSWFAQCLKEEYSFKDGTKNGDLLIRSVDNSHINIEFTDNGERKSTAFVWRDVSEKVTELIKAGKYLPENTRDNSAPLTNSPVVGRKISDESARQMWKNGFAVYADGKPIDRYDFRNRSNSAEAAGIFDRKGVVFSAEETDIKCNSLIDTVAGTAEEFNGIYASINSVIDSSEWLDNSPADPYDLVRNAIAIGDFQPVEDYFDKLLNYIKSNEDLEMLDNATAAITDLKSIFPNYLGSDSRAAYYYFPDDASNDDFQRIQKADEYAIAASAFTFSDEFMKENNIHLYKVGEDLSDTFTELEYDYQRYEVLSAKHMLETAKEISRNANKPFAELNLSDAPGVTVNQFIYMAALCKEDEFKIYQMKSDDEYHFKRFAGLDELDEAPNIADYDLVYTGYLSDYYKYGDNSNDLDNIFSAFNLHKPADYKGRSMSVSDVLVLHGTTPYYVDGIGYGMLSKDFLEAGKKPVTAISTDSGLNVDFGKGQTVRITEKWESGEQDKTDRFKRTTTFSYEKWVMCESISTEKNGEIWNPESRYHNATHKDVDIGNISNFIENALDEPERFSVSIISGEGSSREINVVPNEILGDVIETSKPLGLFMAKEGERWVAVDNETGDAWTEDFASYDEAVNWLNGTDGTPARDNSAISQKETEKADIPAFRDIPFYTKSPQEAREAGELDDYFASRKENAACAKAIDKYSVEFYNNHIYDSNAVLNAVLSEFPAERVEYVVAANVADAPSYDVRLSEENRVWAAKYMSNLPEKYSDISGIILHTHRGLLDMFTAAVREHSELTMAKKYITEFLDKEYEEKPDFSDMHHVTAGSTTFGDDNEHDIQADVDLIDFAVYYIIDGEAADTKKYASLEEMNELLLSTLEAFDNNLISTGYSILEKNGVGENVDTHITSEQDNSAISQQDSTLRLKLQKTTDDYDEPYIIAEVDEDGDFERFYVDESNKNVLFESVEEALVYAEKNGFRYINSERKLDKWREDDENRLAAAAEGAVKWEPVPESADDKGRITSYSAKVDGEIYWISENSEHRYDIETKVSDKIAPISEDYMNIPSRREAEKLFEEYIEEMRLTADERKPSYLDDKFLFSTERVVLQDDFRGLPETAYYMTSVNDYYVNGIGWIPEAEYDMEQKLSGQNAQNFYARVEHINADYIDGEGTVSQRDMTREEYARMTERTYDPENAAALEAAKAKYKERCEAAGVTLEKPEEYYAVGRTSDRKFEILHMGADGEISVLKSGIESLSAAKREMESIFDNRDRNVKTIFAHPQTLENKSAEIKKAAAEKKPENKYTIYLVKDGDEYNGVRTDYRAMKKNGYIPDKNAMFKAYSGSVRDITKLSLKDVILERIYSKFNGNCPEDYKNRSLSVGDIIVLETEKGKSAYMVDKNNFADVSDYFFDLEREKINISELSEIKLITEYDRFTAPDEADHILDTIAFTNLNSLEIRRDKDTTLDYDEMPDYDEGVMTVTMQSALEELEGFFDRTRLSPDICRIEITDKNGNVSKIKDVSTEFVTGETELAFKTHDGSRFITIFERSDEGYDYSIYDSSLKEIDGGVYDDGSISIRKALEIVLSDNSLPAIRELVPLDHDSFIDNLAVKEQEQSEQTERESESEQLNPLEMAKKYITEYIDREFASKTDFSDLHHISMGFTELGDNNEISFIVEADLIDRKISYFLDGEVYNTENYLSLEQMNRDLLENISFDEFIYDGESLLEDMGERWDVRVSRAANISNGVSTFLNETEKNPEHGFVYGTYPNYRAASTALEKLRRALEDNDRLRDELFPKCPYYYREIKKPMEISIDGVVYDVKSIDRWTATVELSDADTGKVITRSLEELDAIVNGKPEPSVRYELQLTSEAFEEPYIIAIVNADDDFEKYYEDSDREYALFESVDRALRYAKDNGITFINDKAQLESWREADREAELPEKKPSFLSDGQEYDGSEQLGFEPEQETSDYEIIEPFTPKPKTALDFTITYDNFNSGKGTAARFNDNVKAIRTLKLIESENRLATPEEQRILAGYIGWGALSNAFKEIDPRWEKEYAELKELLTKEEFEEARATTNDAFYTSPIVIKAIYEAIENMGFKGGRILEPSMGTGNFFGAMPESIRANSDLTGVEIDSITGRIAKQLYQNADVNISGYEDTSFENDSFDIAIGNVPFGNHMVFDKDYLQLGYRIHDYFFAKTLDKVHPGGIIAFVTSQGTMDKENPEVRKYLAERAELLGAIRLPSTAFLGMAGTDATTDIIFLQKRDEPIAVENSGWEYKSITDDGIPVNEYFSRHPEMILGQMVEGNKMYGKNGTMCLPFPGEGSDEALKMRLAEAIKNIHGEYREQTAEHRKKQLDGDTIPAPADSKRNSYIVSGSDVYYRETSSYMTKVKDSKTVNTNMIKVLITLRDKTVELLETQENNADGSLDGEVKEKLAELNRIYDRYAAKYGRINDKASKQSFSDDMSYQLLKSLERLDTKGNFIGKADVLLKPVITPKAVINRVDNPKDALIVSLAEKMAVDMDFMSGLTGMSEEALAEALRGEIFRNPENDMKWEPSEEYLSGNVVRKLDAAVEAGMEENAAALRLVQPEPIPAQDIDVKLGAAWIEPEYVRQFALEVFDIMDKYTKEHFKVEYSEEADMWSLEGYTKDWGNVMLNQVYGTNENNAFSILEKTLNLKNINVYRDKKDEYGHIIYDVNDNPVRELDPERTEVNRDKQEAIRRKFKEWIFSDPDRRKYLVDKYNRTFNNLRLRKYDGSSLRFAGMSKDIVLRPHQKDAVLRGLCGQNLLLAHEVGAGKTYVMVAIAMEGKRLGLFDKTMMAVPKHLIQQTGEAFMKLYPAANIYVAGENDFSPENRRATMAKIALNDWDAVIVGHTQFDRCQLSPDLEERYIKEEIANLDRALRSAEDDDNTFSIKKIEEAKKRLEVRLERSNERAAKDDFLDFNLMGIGKVIVDESQAYKNLATPTKMSNIAGVSSSGSDRSLQFLMKCRYMDEKTGGKGVILSSGTPISNSMTEMYTVMRYLASAALTERRLDSFDKWAKVFGETKNSMELKPTGDGRYQMRTRFANFTNLPELMTMFKSFADVKLAENLDLDRPDECEVHNVKIKANRYQRKFVKELGARAEDIHSGLVDPTEDNMLKVTTDGRKVGLDARCFDPTIPDDPHSKVNVCINNVFDIWKKTADKRSTQLIFCDLATPKEPENQNEVIVFRKQHDGTYKQIYSEALRKRTLDSAYNKLVTKPPEDFVNDPSCGAIEVGDIIMTRVVDTKTEKALCAAYRVGEKGAKEEPGQSDWQSIGYAPEADVEVEKRFCVYDDIKEKLIKMGVPAEEIAFIHDAKTDASKVKLFDQMNKGEIRILIGSSAKCGSGMNAQEKMIALHDLDAPLRPSDADHTLRNIIKWRSFVFCRIGLIRQLCLRVCSKYQVSGQAQPLRRYLQARLR